MTDQKPIQKAILKTLQDSYPTSLRPFEIAKLSGYSDSGVRENLQLMDSVMMDPRHKVPRWRPTQENLHPEDQCSS